MSVVHVYPLGDLVDHDTEGDDCVCGPLVEPVPRDDGSYGWLLTHHTSLRGNTKALPPSLRLGKCRAGLPVGRRGLRGAAGILQLKVPGTASSAMSGKAARVR